MSGKPLEAVRLLGSRQTKIEHSKVQPTPKPLSGSGASELGRYTLGSMKSTALVGLIMLSTHAFATDTLDCVAKPYYLSVIVSHEHGPQQFSLSTESGELAGGEIALWDEFRLHWPNALGSKGNSIRLHGEFPMGLSVNGMANGEAGTLVVNGKRHVFKCDWTK